MLNFFDDSVPLEQHVKMSALKLRSLWDDKKVSWGKVSSGLARHLFSKEIDQLKYTRPLKVAKFRQRVEQHHGKYLLKPIRFVILLNHIFMFIFRVR